MKRPDLNSILRLLTFSTTSLWLLSFGLSAPAANTPAKFTAAQDDCAFIRENLRRLPAEGGEVLIPAGLYTCNSPIVMDRNDVSLRGAGGASGAETVTLRLGNNANSPVLIMGDTATPPKPVFRIRVSNLMIDGNRWSQKTECWGGPCDGGGHSFIRNNGITVRAVTNGRIENVSISSARSGGVVTEKGCYDLIINNLTAIDNEFDGFAGYETTGARLTGLKLLRNRAAGISVDIRFNGNIFRDIQIENNGDVGIFMRDSSMNIFENVSIKDSGSHGVFLAHAEDLATCPLGNEFQNLNVVHSRGYGFRLNDACEGNSLSGTTHFSKNRDGCVSEGPGAHLKIPDKVICDEE